MIARPNPGEERRRGEGNNRPDDGSKFLGRGPSPGFFVSVAFKEDKVVCFLPFLQVLIPKSLFVHVLGFKVRWEFPQIYTLR
jgi:hypothetical protein